MVNQLDIYATIAEVVGDKVKDNEAEDSFSFAGTFTGKNFSRQAMIHHSISGGFAIRKGKWKLVLGTGPRANHISGKRELYNLEKDPQEKHNVIEQHAELSQEMEKDITSIILRGRSGKGPKAENDTPVKLPWKTN
jgi:arylsulfatase A-like enzyme